jgi:hypothetical protein
MSIVRAARREVQGEARIAASVPGVSQTGVSSRFVSEEGDA